MTSARWVADGPVVGSDWCVLADPPTDVVAPGGVVLCHAGTLRPHPDATKAAEAARVAAAAWNMTHRVIEGTPA